MRFLNSERRYEVEPDQGRRPGAGGAVLRPRFYATIPKGVIGLGAGSFGETGRGIQEYHALIAKSKSF